MRILRGQQGRACSKLCKNKLKLLRQKNIRLRIIKILGNCCKHCGTEDRRLLQIDHINGNGSLNWKKTKNGNRSRMGCEKTLYIILNGYTNLQILCANCHMIKTYENKDNLRKVVAVA